MYYFVFELERKKERGRKRRREVNIEFAALETSGADFQLTLLRPLFFLCLHSNLQLLATKDEDKNLEFAALDTSRDF